MNIFSVINDATKLYRRNISLTDLECHSSEKNYDRELEYKDEKTHEENKKLGFQSDEEEHKFFDDRERARDLNNI